MLTSTFDNGPHGLFQNVGGGGDVFYSSRNYAQAVTDSNTRPTSIQGIQFEQQAQQNGQQQFSYFQKQPQQAHHMSVNQLNTATIHQPDQPQRNTPLMRGWLYHFEGWPLKTWHKRWAVLRPGTLNVYKSSTSDKLVNSFLLHNYQITVSGRGDKNFRTNAFRCEAPGLKTLYFATDTAEEMSDWIRSLQNAVQPMGTFHSYPQRQKEHDIGDYTQHSNTLPYHRQTMTAQNLNGAPYQPQLQQHQNFYGHKQSPPLPPPVRFPPPPPQQHQQQPLGIYQQQPPTQFANIQQQNNYENQQPNQYVNMQSEQKPSQDISASRLRYGAFIQQLDEERRKRSMSMNGLPETSGCLPVQPLQQQPLYQQFQNGVPQPSYQPQYSRDARYDSGYSAIPPEINTHQHLNNNQQPFLSQQPSLPSSTQLPQVVEPPIIPQTSNRYSAPFLLNALQQQMQFERETGNYDSIGSSGIANVSVPLPQQKKIEAYSSPSITNHQNFEETRTLTNQNSMPKNQPKIPNLQERVYSLMRCVNSQDSGQQAENPSLTHWLVRDMITSSTAINETGAANPRRVEEDPNDTLTPHNISLRNHGKPAQSNQMSPQYSQVVKKISSATSSQSSSMYVEHWLDAHASESQSSVAVDDHVSSPEPPRRVEDIFGKTRDELVLMLIQLRRRQAQGRYVDPTLYQIIEQQLAAERSVISLVDNVVAPYGSPESSTLRRQRNNERLASERAIVSAQLDQNSASGDFESKQAIFWRLDEAVNRQTEVVTSLQEQHQQLIDAIGVIRSRMTVANDAQIHQLTQLESSLHGIRASLATASRHLESLIFQRDQLEKQLQELKARQTAVNSSIVNRSVSVPSLIAQQQPRQEAVTKLPQPPRFFPQPVVPVAPMLQRQQEANDAVQQHSPVYATVRRYQNQNTERKSAQKVENPELQERQFKYVQPPAKTEETKYVNESEFKQPEPIYSRPLRFTPSQQQVPAKISSPANSNRLLPSQRNQNMLPPLQPAASLSMLSDAGSEATIDSLARQYTTPFVAKSSAPVPANAQPNPDNDSELVDMVQRAMQVVKQPDVSRQQQTRISSIIPPADQQQTSAIHGNTSASTTTSNQHRRFSAHLRVPTPPPAPENQSSQNEGYGFEVEPESFERDVFGAPDKIDIPERYDPAADASDSWTSTDSEEKEQRTERYRQMLLKQSLSNLTSEEAGLLSAKSNDLHEAIREESQERSRLLRLSQTLAQQAKSATLNQVERLRRSTPSGLNNQSPPFRYIDGPPMMPPPPPPLQPHHDQSSESPNSGSNPQGQSPETLWMEMGQREMAIDVC